MNKLESQTQKALRAYGAEVVRLLCAKYGLPEAEAQAYLVTVSEPAVVVKEKKPRGAPVKPAKKILEQEEGVSSVLSSVPSSEGSSEPSSEGSSEPSSEGSSEPSSEGKAKAKPKKKPVNKIALVDDMIQSILAEQPAVTLETTPPPAASEALPKKPKAVKKAVVKEVTPEPTSAETPAETQAAPKKKAPAAKKAVAKEVTPEPTSAETPAAPKKKAPAKKAVVKEVTPEPTPTETPAAPKKKAPAVKKAVVKEVTPEPVVVAEPVVVVVKELSPEPHIESETEEEEEEEEEEEDDGEAEDAEPFVHTDGRTYLRTVETNRILDPEDTENQLGVFINGVAHFDCE